MASGKILVALAVACALVQLAAGAEFVVGDSSGWTFADYTNWASGKTFRVGDTLRFDFSSNHDVLEVSKSNYDSCTALGPIQDFGAQGPVTVTLSRTGDHYYICGVTGHCTSGMKVSVNVVAAQDAPQSGNPSPRAAAPSTPVVPVNQPGASLPPLEQAPAPSGASSLAVAGWIATAATAAGLILAA